MRLTAKTDNQSSIPYAIMSDQIKRQSDSDG